MIAHISNGGNFTFNTGIAKSTGYNYAIKWHNIVKFLWHFVQKVVGINPTNFNAHTLCAPACTSA